MSVNIDRKFLFFMIGFLVGIFIEAIIGWGVSLGVAFGFWAFRKKVLLAFLIGILVGVVRFFVSDFFYEDDVRNLNGSGMIEFTACVSSEVDVRVSQIKYTVSDVCVVVEKDSHKCYGGDVLLNANRYPVLKYGDVLKVKGELISPEPIEAFEYDKYLARYGVYSVVYRPYIEKIGDGCGNFFFKSIYTLKNVFEKKLGEIFTEPHGSLVAGVLLGVRKGIPEGVANDFQEVGLTHIVAISGYNITLVIIVVSGMFGFLSRRLRTVASVVFIVIFVILVGAGSAVVRAAIMGVLGLAALYWGRKSDVAMAIVLSAFVMNLWNPLIAVYDVGFQLSFLATLGLVYVSPKIEGLGGVLGRFLARIPRFFLIRENFIMTLSAQTFALPIILKSFGKFSLVCPIANIFVLPFIPFIMLFGFLAVVFGFFSQTLGAVFAFGARVILDVVFFFVGFFADLSRLYM